MVFAIKTILLQGLTLLLPEMIAIPDHTVQAQTAVQDPVILVAVEAEDRLAVAEEAEEDNPIRFTYITH
jgi:hypothetical protein